MKKILFALLYILCSSAPVAVFSQSGVTVPNEDTIVALMKRDHVPLAGICLIENGQLKYVKTFSTANKSVSENTFFNIASLTKPLVTMLTLKLVTLGQWQLDEPLFHYWTDPDVVQDPRNMKLTTRLVLSHQTGLPNWRGHEPGGKLSFEFEPGSKWKYSGEGYEYLREAIEHKFKIPIEKLGDSLLFRKIGMTQTKFYWDQDTDSALYAGRFHEDGTPYAYETWQDANASNLVLTTVRDYGNFGLYVMKKIHSNAGIYAEMIKTQSRPSDRKEFGLGWSITRGLSNGEYALTHTGSNPGVNTIILLLPKSGRGIIVFTNSDSGRKLYSDLTGISIDLGNEIMKRIE
jgi:CubicO group peptidase (beta-lactamase class C family)